MNPLHTIYSMSVGRYSKIDDTSNISLFKKWWNILPDKWFAIDETIAEFGMLINNKESRYKIVETSRLIMINKIMLLESLHSVIYSLMVTKRENDIFNQFKTPEEVTNLKVYIKQIEDMTTIQIKSMLDINLLQKEISRLNDKYMEQFGEDTPDIPDVNDTVPFTRYAISIFEGVNMQYDKKLKMSEFIQMVILVSDKAKQLEKLKTNG